MRVTIQIDLTLPALWRLCALVEAKGYVIREDLPEDWRPYLTRSSSRQGLAIRAALRGVLRYHRPGNSIRLPFDFGVWSVARDWRARLTRLDSRRRQVSIPWTCDIKEAA